MDLAALARTNIAATIGDLEAMVVAVAKIAPQQRATSFSVGDGRAVLLGPGLFVNRVFGLGLSAPVDAQSLEEFEERCAELGQDATIDVSTHADPRTTDLLAGRGYVPDDTVVALCRSVEGPYPAQDHRVEVVSVDTLEEWCNATAAGWGHDGTDRREGSDLYGHAAFAAQSPGLLLARPPGDDRVSGCAALAIVGETAILGGMSTLPEFRRTGVQTTMISARLQMAAERGCTMAATQAASAGDSLRNLLRHGFVEVDRITEWTKPRLHTTH